MIILFLMVIVLFWWFDRLVKHSEGYVSKEEKLDVINERTDSIEEKIDSIERKGRPDWHSETIPNSDVKQYRPRRNRAS